MYVFYIIDPHEQLLYRFTSSTLKAKLLFIFSLYFSVLIFFFDSSFPSGVKFESNFSSP